MHEVPTFLPPIIAALCILSVILVVLASIQKYRSAIPTDEVAGIRVRWMPGAERPWEDLDLAIYTMEGTAFNEFDEKLTPDMKKRLTSFWIEVHPYETKALPGLNGEFKRESYYFGFVRQDVLRVRQLKSGEVSAGAVLPADQSGLFHEFAEHLLPDTLEGYENVKHSQKWLDVTLAIDGAFRAISRKG